MMMVYEISFKVAILYIMMNPCAMIQNDDPHVWLLGEIQFRCPSEMGWVIRRRHVYKCIYVAPTPGTVALR